MRYEIVYVSCFEFLFYDLPLCNIVYLIGQKYHTINLHNCEIRKALPKAELEKIKSKAPSKYGGMYG